MALKSIAAAVVACVMSVSAACAATLTVTGVTGNWSAVTPGSVPGLTGEGTSKILWGVPQTRAGKSGYEFTPVTAGLTVQDGVTFNLGTFTHLNNTIDHGTSITGAQLGVSINVAINGVTRTILSTFDFLHDETNNNPGRGVLCANGLANGRGLNRNGCADRVTLVRNDAFSDEVEIDGVLYALDITGFLFNGQLLREFWTVEQNTNSAILQAVFRSIGPSGPGEPSPVPLPAAGWLLVASLGGLAAAKKLRRKA